MAFTRGLITYYFYVGIHLSYSQHRLVTARSTFICRPLREHLVASRER